MGSTEAAYRKPAQFASGKNALDSAHELLPLARASDLHPRRRIVLLAMLECNAFAVAGSRNELYPATLTVAVKIGLPTITVRRAIDGLEAAGVLKLVRHENWIDPRGEIRRPRTYQVNPERLAPRMTLSEHRKLRFGGKLKRTAHCKVVPIEKSAPPPSAPDPAPTAPQQGHRSSERQSPKLTPRQRARLAQARKYYLEGCAGSIQSREGSQYVGPNDPRYREPMGAIAATMAACKAICEAEGVSMKRAIEAALEAGFQVDPEQARNLLAGWTPETDGDG